MGAGSCEDTNCAGVGSCKREGFRDEAAPAKRGTCMRRLWLAAVIAMVIWSRVHGIVSLEIAGNLPPFGAKGDDLYLYELQSIERQFIKAAESGKAVR